MPSTRLGAIALAAAIGLSAVAAQPPAAMPGVAATVNGEAIRLEQVDAFIVGKLAVTPLTNVQLRALRAEVVSDLIDDLVLKQFLTENAPKVDPAEVDRQLKAFAESLAKRGQTFAGFLKETNQTEAAVRESWTAVLQLHGYVKQHIGDDRLKQFYIANKDYFDGVEVKARHIVIRVGPKSPATEKALAKEKLKALRADIASGKIDFSAAAKQFSQCPSASLGGDLGFIPRKGGPMDEPFARAAFALKIGEVSDIVETEFGLHLIRVSERKPGNSSEFEKCVEDVRDAFADEYRAELLGKLRKKAAISIALP